MIFGSPASGGRNTNVAARAAKPIAFATLAGTCLLLYALSTGKIRPTSQTLESKIKLRPERIQTPGEAAELISRKSDK